MKKAIILIVFIVLVLISIFRCEQPDLVLTPQSVDPNEHGLSLGKKPVNQPTIIELFGIYDNQSGEPVYLIENISIQ